MVNLLVDLMPEAVRNEIGHAGSEFRLRNGQVVDPESLEGSFVFIVTEGVASKFVRSEVGRVSEVGMVGHEGMFPVCALLRVPAAPHLVISQVGVLNGRRIRTREFFGIVGESELAEALIRKYCYAFISQIASNILSSEQNAVATRLARWLLMCHDRIEGDVIAITHDTLAQMSFAYRPTVTTTLHEMRDDGLIDLSRAQIRIRDRTRLCDMADGSYGMSEKYWQEHIRPFGKPVSGDQKAYPRDAELQLRSA